jgi:molybdopterin molybdotransferase
MNGVSVTGEDRFTGVREGDASTRVREGGAADLPWAVAYDRARRLPFLLGVERVPVDAAHRRVLAESVRAIVALPGCDTAAMDGYAVAGPPPWRVVGRVSAGRAAPAGPLARGAAVEIATGAELPVGATAVIPYERSQRDGDDVTTPWVDAADAGTHVRIAGEDAQPGDEIVPAGRLLTAAALGAAAQTGADSLLVYRRPRVRMLVTGDEVVATGIPRPGTVRDALGPAISAIVDRADGVVVDRGYLADDRVALLEAVHDANDVDVLVVTGSSSVGVADHLHEVLDRIGARWHVDGVACRPGHPQALAETADGRWVVGLPGNPFAGLVAAMTLLEPVLSALGGRPYQTPVELPVTGPVQSWSHGVRLVPVLRHQAHAVVVASARPASLRAAAAADALAAIGPHWTSGAVATLLDLP